jgi:hypothetical protein
MNIANLFKNNSLDTDSYEYMENNNNNEQYGGNNDVPTGGFLPIYICSIKKKEDEQKQPSDEQSKREYKTPKNVVSIKSILEKRRKNTPFIKI